LTRLCVCVVIDLCYDMCYTVVNAFLFFCEMCCFHAMSSFVRCPLCVCALYV